MILINPNEPYVIRSGFGDYGIPTPSLQVDYGWFAHGKKSLIERKHVPEDLLSSMSDGRLNREMQVVLENIEKGGNGYLLLEGFMQCNREDYIVVNGRPSGWKIDQISERLSTIQLMGVKLLLSPGIQQTPFIIVSQYRWELKDEHKSLKTRPGPVSEWGKPSYSGYMLWSYQGIPGVGSDIAETLYEAASTWAALVKLSVEDLMELKRFGRKRAERVFRFIHEGKL